MPALARAEEALSRSAIREDMSAYYASERSTTLTMMSYGALSLFAGAALSTRSDDLSKGLGGSMIVLGALADLGGASYVSQVNGEIRHYSDELSRNPADFRRDEIAHLAGTSKRFVFYRSAELTTFALGVGGATYGFAAKKDAWQGIGIGTALEAGLLFTIDSMNNRRAALYQEQLARFDVGLSIHPPAADQPAWLGVSGRF